MVRRSVLSVLLTLTLVIAAVPQRATMAADQYAVTYTLTITRNNQAAVTIAVSGAPGPATELNADWMGTVFAAVGPVNVTESSGRTLPFTWKGPDKRTLQVQNGSSSDFVIHYEYDALRTIGPVYQAVVFEPRTVLFIADQVFLMPNAEPATIAVKVVPPVGTQVFSSLAEEKGQFVATKDLWGDLRYDFGKAYFSGGVPLFTLDHRTEWGDLYRYIWFDRDAASQMWMPSYGNAPWEEAEAYMALAEQSAKYLREHVMGPLPPHTVLFTDVRRAEDVSHAIMSNVDFFHHMQIWPRDSEGELTHHLLHAYTFHMYDQSKLSLQTSGFRLFLREGLPTYFALTVPAHLNGEERHLGKLFEFWALEERGRPFGIQSNTDYHVKYNQSTMRVYLLNRYIQRVTGGTRDIADFTQAMWDEVKDRKAPAEFTEADALNAFARVVGPTNVNYIRQVDALREFPAAEFTPLRPAFRSYAQWMADRWFAGNPLLFLAYLDIMAAKGGVWPHYASFPHQVPFRLREAMLPFWSHLKGKSGSYTQGDILAALKAATGKAHDGFFEFWDDQGFALDPASLKAARDWNPDAAPEGDRMPQSWNSTGRLETTHNLAGVPQQAAALLDAPAPDSAVVIDVSLSNPSYVPPMAQARAALSGQNVTLLDTFSFELDGATYVKAQFRVTTTDPERRRFAFELALPPAQSYPHFQVLRDGNHPDRQLGELYFLPSIPPMEFDLTCHASAQKLTLPDVQLPGATFAITDGRNIIRALPGETVQLQGDSPGVALLDRYGFLRGSQSLCAAPPPTPPSDGRKPAIPAAAEGEIRVVVNGNSIAFDVAPVTVNGRVMVPLRPIAEALRARVDWDPVAQVITLSVGSHIIGVSIGGTQAKVDGQPIFLDVAPEIRDGRTLVPVRFIAQALGAVVGWEEASRTVTITTGQ